MTNRFNKAALLAGTVMAGAVFATPAMAQGTPDEPALETGASEPNGELIVVTGSRIARRDLETAAPVAVVNSEEFELSGSVNVESVINTLPQVVPGTTSFSNNPGDGTATLNLRGLGATRTLVLVNGRRWMFYNTDQVVDLNTIPQFLLESVDVVTGGASAVYGSDAIAGVVNFRLKDVQGVEVGGQYSLTERGDGARYEVHGAIGSEFADGRGSATVYAEYYKRDSIFQGDRDFSNFALGGETDGGDLQQFGSSTLPSGVLRYLGGAQGNTGLPAGTEFGAAGTNGFGTGVVFDQPRDFRRRAGDLYNYAPVNYLQLPQERYLLGGYADYELGGGHRAYAEVSYVNNQVEAALAATPVTGNFNVDLATVQPFLVAGDFAQLQAIDAAETAQNATDGVADDPGVVNLYVQRRVTETGLRQNLDERNSFRILGGITGPIGDYLNYDAYYMYARTRNANIQQGNISRSNFQAGLDGTGTPINIFGPGTLTPEMVDSITIQAQNGDISSLQVATAVISGTFGDFAITRRVGVVCPTPRHPIRSASPSVANTARLPRSSFRIPRSLRVTSSASTPVSPPMAITMSANCSPKSRSRSASVPQLSISRVRRATPTIRAARSVACGPMPVASNSRRSRTSSCVRSISVRFALPTWVNCSGVWRSASRVRPTPVRLPVRRTMPRSTRCASRPVLRRAALVTPTSVRTPRCPPPSVVTPLWARKPRTATPSVWCCSRVSSRGSRSRPTTSTSRLKTRSRPSVAA